MYDHYIGGNRKHLIGREVKEGDDEPNNYVGTKRGDTYHGLGGDDDIYGRRGSDKLFGDNGEDLIVGEYGNDKLFGGKQADELDGREGNDVLDGGPGSDLFFFWNKYDDDTIVDFEPGSDEINLFGLSGIDGFGDLKQDHMANVGGNTVITGADGDTLTIKNMKRADFDADDFTFAFG